MCLLQDSKTTFVTVNQTIKFFATVIVVNSKTTFVTVNLQELRLALEYQQNSKTTFVTVNHCKKAHSNKPVKFKNNFCYC